MDDEKATANEKEMEYLRSELEFMRNNYNSMKDKCERVHAQLILKTAELRKEEKANKKLMKILKNLSKSSKKHN